MRPSTRRGRAAVVSPKASVVLPTDGWKRALAMVIVTTGRAALVVKIVSATPAACSIGALIEADAAAGTTSKDGEAVISLPERTVSPGSTHSSVSGCSSA